MELEHTELWQESNYSVLENAGSEPDLVGQEPGKRPRSLFQFPPILYLLWAAATTTPPHPISNLTNGQ